VASKEAAESGRADNAPREASRLREHQGNICHRCSKQNVQWATSDEPCVTCGYFKCTIKMTGWESMLQPLDRRGR